jgi:hypothetical protein
MRICNRLEGTHGSGSYLHSSSGVVILIARVSVDNVDFIFAKSATCFHRGRMLELLIIEPLWSCFPLSSAI